MKLAIVILAVVAAANAQQFNPFGQYNKGQYNQGQYNPLPYRQYKNQPRTPSPFSYVSTTPAPIVSYTPTAYPYPTPVVKVYRTDAGNANIVNYGNDANPDGSFKYFYETDNGIAAQEQGVPRAFGGNPPVEAVVVQGSYSYTNPEGKVVAISYIADENGFQPQGDVIPTPHPVPEAILRSLEFNARSKQ